MAQVSRLFEIIQALRVASQPVTGAQLATSLGVTVRSIYRDIAALQALRVPIVGGRGIGYIMRPGFELPPLMFSIEETEAVVLALAMLARTGDPELTEAARRVNQKITAAVPPPLRAVLAAKALHAWGAASVAPDGVNLGLVRRAIRDEQKLAIEYRDNEGTVTSRTILPVELIYYSDAANIVAHCELRRALRNFRAERIARCTELQAFFPGQGDGLRQQWRDGWGKGG